MFFIAHRGNVTGRRPNLENFPDYVQRALSQGFDVEVDVWYVDGQFWLGHDGPTFEVGLDFLRNPKVWCHAKDIDTLYKLTTLPGIHYFFHEDDQVAMTSGGYLWTFPGKLLTTKSICVMPEKSGQSVDVLCAGICSDDINKYRSLYDN